MGDSRELGRLAHPRVMGAAPTVLVPVGSTEQHGPHLPLDTDTRVAAAVAAEAAAGLGEHTLVAPPVCYGSSGEHQDFPGTVSIGTAALTELLVEYGRSACRWADRLVFVNGHGGNLEALAAAAGRLRDEGREVAWFGCTVAGGDAHAGHTETSLLLHLAPVAVRVGEIRPGNTEPLAELMPRLRAGGVGAVNADGVLGDPTTATAEAGARYLAAMVADCTARVLRWQPGPGGMLT